ncbi:unnamed protein product [Lampetra planeri]
MAASPGDAFERSPRSASDFGDRVTNGDVVIHLQPALPPLFLLAQRDGAAQSRGRVGGAATPTRRSLDSVAKGFTRQDRASLEHGSCPRGGPGGPGRHLGNERLVISPPLTTGRALSSRTWLAKFARNLCSVLGSC